MMHFKPEYLKLTFYIFKLANIFNLILTMYIFSVWLLT